MAWLEKIAADGAVEIRVAEARGKALWERRARGKNRGRTVLVSEHASDAAAAAAHRARLAELETEGFVLIDPEAGIDARRPRGRASPVDGRLTADDLVRELRKGIPEDPRSLRARDLLGLFDRSMKLPRAYRARGYHCDLTVHGRLTLCVMVSAVEGAWREVGYDAVLELPDDHEASLDDILGEGVPWDAFRRDLLADEAWRSVADLRCESVEPFDSIID